MQTILQKKQSVAESVQNLVKVVEELESLADPEQAKDQPAASSTYPCPRTYSIGTNTYWLPKISKLNIRGLFQRVSASLAANTKKRKLSVFASFYRPNPNLTFDDSARLKRTLIHHGFNLTRR